MKRRKRRGRKEWERLVGEQEKSGIDVASFCRGQDIGVVSFYRWRKRLSGDAGRGVEGGQEAFIDIGRVVTEQVGMESGAKAVAGSLVVRLDLGGGALLTIERV